MDNDYQFLSDHSYSMLDTLSLQQRIMKSKKSLKNSIRANKTASIDRSSSDKENAISNSNNSLKTVKNKTKSSAKKKSTGSNISTTSRTQLKKKQNNKTSSKVTKEKNSIVDKSIERFDSPPILSIEERVKLRRTKPLATTPITPILTKKPKKNRTQVSKPAKSVVKPKKFFLGSGLDLDNIVLGNRQRRSVKT